MDWMIDLINTWKNKFWEILKIKKYINKNIENYQSPIWQEFGYTWIPLSESELGSTCGLGAPAKYPTLPDAELTRQPFKE